MVLTVGIRTTRRVLWRGGDLRLLLCRPESLAGVGVGGGRSVSRTEASIWRAKRRQMLSRKESKEKGERWGARERRGSPELAWSLTSYRRLWRNGGAAIGQPGGGALGFRGGGEMPREARAFKGHGRRGRLRPSMAGGNHGRRDCRGRGRD